LLSGGVLGGLERREAETERQKAKGKNQKAKMGKRRAWRCDASGEGVGEI